MTLILSTFDYSQTTDEKPLIGQLDRVAPVVYFDSYCGSSGMSRIDTCKRPQLLKLIETDGGFMVHSGITGDIDIIGTLLDNVFNRISDEDPINGHLNEHNLQKVFTDIFVEMKFDTYVSSTPQSGVFIYEGLPFIYRISDKSDASSIYLLDATDTVTYCNSLMGVINTMFPVEILRDTWLELTMEEYYFLLVLKQDQTRPPVYKCRFPSPFEQTNHLNYTPIVTKMDISLHPKTRKLVVKESIVHDAILHMNKLNSLKYAVTK